MMRHKPILVAFLFVATVFENKQYYFSLISARFLYGSFLFPFISCITQQRNPVGAALNIYVSPDTICCKCLMPKQIISWPEHSSGRSACWSLQGIRPNCYAHKIMYELLKERSEAERNCFAAGLRGRGLLSVSRWEANVLSNPVLFRDSSECK